MRSDMAKVLVERSRYGRRIDFGERRSRYARKTRSRHDEQALPERMPIGFAPSKGLNENLRPLLRFLRSRRGQPWDRVYAEIRRHLAPKSAVDMHVMQHLWDYVLRSRRLADGRKQLLGHSGCPVAELATDGRWMSLPPGRYGLPFRGGVLYVCCDTGLLREVGEVRKRYKLKLVAVG